MTDSKKWLMWGLFAIAFIFLSTISLSLLSSGGQDTVDLVIPKGKSLKYVSDFLHDNGVVSHPFLFRMLLKFTGGTSHVRAGEYRFQKPMSSIGALVVLYHSDPILHAVTVPEGYNVRLIAQILAQEKLVDEKKFIQLALSKQMANKFGIHAPHLEGFLYPETYQFSKLDGEEKILEQMVGQMKNKFEKDFKAQADKMGWSFEKTITFASIVEKETGKNSERELVSSVFHNRLKKKMRLQSDPTTIYGASNYQGRITTAMLHTYSPYNTYTIPALPPGPIASPGEAAIRATLNPATSDYLYFVTTAPGVHTFSKSYEQHARHVNSTLSESTKKKKAKR